VLRFGNVEAANPVESVTTGSGTLTNPALPTLTSTVPNCLAVCVMAFSDNIQGGAEPTASGATGGTWVRVALHSGVTDGADIGYAIFAAELSTATTISGGSVSFTSSSPARQLSRHISFVLRGDPA
jgi:hypothetical protein